MRKRLFFLFDLFVVGLSPFAAIAIRHNFTPTTKQLLDIVPFALLGVCVAALVFVIIGTHRSIWRYVSLSDFSRIFAAVAITLLVTMFVAFSLNRLDSIGRSIPLIEGALIVSGMIFARILARALIRRRSVLLEKKSDVSREHVLVVGLNHVAELYLRCIDSLASNRIAVAGLLDEQAVMKGRLLHQNEVLGQPQDLSQILAVLNIHGIMVRRVVITTPFKDLSKASRDELLKLERSNIIELDLFEERLGFADSRPETLTDKGTGITPGRLSGQVPEDDGDDFSLNRGYLATKRFLDIVGSLSLIFALSPVALVLSLLVALDVGFPLTFWQERPGRGGRPFRVYKFRTMHPAHDESGKRIPDEQRQSGLGRFIRRTRLDELPQLFNILTGEMSFVGPRPLLPIDQPEGANPRLFVRPGLTGWAQVNGGKTVSVADKAVLDIWYIKSASLMLDLKIILKTIDMVIRGERFNESAVLAAYEELGLERHAVSPSSRSKEDVSTEVETDNTIILARHRKIA